MRVVALLFHVNVFVSPLLHRIGARQVLSPSRDLDQSQPIADSTEIKHIVAQKNSNWNVYTYWDYPNGPDPFVRLNMKTWAHNLPPGTKVVYVNDTNFFDLVPDAPKEWLKMPDYGSKSDMVRSAVLYHQGGLYMDTDFLVAGPLDKVMKRLDEGWDAILYSDEMGQKETGPCILNRSFSSNFMAARKGNPFLGTWWENIKMKLTRMCGEYDFENIERVCCHQAFDTIPANRRSCKVPWGYIEHLKQPECDYDRDKHTRAKHCPRPLPSFPHKKPLSIEDPRRQTPEAKRMLALVKQGRAHAKPFPKTTKLLCLAGRDGMAAHINGEVYWQPWNEKNGTTGPNNTVEPHRYEPRFDCREEMNGNLTCDRGNWGPRRRQYEKFFERTAYHLFFTMRVDRKVQSEDEILQKDWLLSELYRRTLGYQKLENGTSSQ